jgi:hypothetical protein
VPYEVGRGHGCPASKPWAVYNGDTGRRYGCHRSEAGARRQQRAMGANAPHAAAAAAAQARAREWLTGGER